MIPEDVRTQVLHEPYGDQADTTCSAHVVHFLVPRKTAKFYLSFHFVELYYMSEYKNQ